MAFQALDLTSVSKPTPSFQPLDLSSTPQSTTPATSTPSFWDTVGGAITSGIHKISDFLTGAAQEPTYTGNSWNETLKNLPNEVVRTILPGAAALNDNPELASKVSNEDLARAIPGALFTQFVAPVASFALTSYGATGAVLNKIGLQTPGVKPDGSVAFNIPGLGEVTNMQARIAQDYANGAPQTGLGIAADIAKYTGTELLNGLYAASLLDFVVNPRMKTIANLNSEQAGQLSVPNRLGTGQLVESTPKSFQLFQKPTITTPTYTQLNPDFVQKLTDTGIDMSKYNPNIPTFFRFALEDGQITGKVIQVKPSFISVFTDALKGDISKVPPTELAILTEQTVPESQIMKTAPASAVVTRISKPTPSFEPLRLTNQTEPSFIPTAQDLGANFADNPTTSPLSIGTRPLAEIQQELSDAKLHLSFLQDAMDGHPGKGAGKYLNWRTGEFLKGADAKYQGAIGQEASGGGDLSVLEEQQKSYQSLQTQEKAVKNEIKRLTLEAKNAPVVPESARTAPTTPEMPVGMGSPGKGEYVQFEGGKSERKRASGFDAYFQSNYPKEITPKAENIPPELQPLATEARKYKSANEFVQSTWKEKVPPNEDIKITLSKLRDTRNGLENLMNNYEAGTRQHGNVNNAISSVNNSIREVNQIEQYGYKSLADFYNKVTKPVVPYYVYTYQDSGNKFVPVEGKPVGNIHPNTEFFVHKPIEPNGKGWIVSEVRSGLRVGEGMTREKAIQNAQELIAKKVVEGVSLKDVVETQVKKYGLSPRFKQTEEYKNLSVEPKPSEPSTLNKGFVSPANIVEDVQKTIKSAQDFIDESKKQVAYSGDLEADHYLLANREEIDRIASLQLTQEAKGTPKDYEQIYHYIENKDEPLTDKQRLIYENEIKPIETESKKLYEKLKSAGIPVSDEGYIHRLVANRGGIIERMKVGFSGSSEGGLLRKTTSSFKHRTMMAIESNGVRKVVSIKDRRVVELSKGKSNYLGNIETRGSKYPKFIDKNDNEWKIAQATTKEIEANTSTTYYKNALVSELVNYDNLKKVDRAIEYLEELKTNPEFERVGIKVGTQNIPSGYRTTELPQLRGYMFPKRIAEVFDDFYHQRAQTGLAEVYGKVNIVLRNSIFFNPLIHIPNIAVHWAVNRGVITLANPMSYPRLISTSMRAIRATLTMNEDYIDILNKGGSLLYSKNVTHDLPKLLLDKMGMELASNKTLAGFISKELGYANPARLVKAVYGFSSKVTWAANDIATLQAIFEEMDKGVPMEKAIEETAKHIPNYRIPARVLNSRAIANLMRGDSGITMFGAYHYGALKSYGEMLKSIEEGLRGKVPPRDILSAIDKIAALVLITYFVYPQLDKIARWVTGNTKAQIRRAGASTFLANTQKIVQSTTQRGKVNAPDISAYLQSFLTPSVGVKGAAELYFGRNTFTGQPTDYTKELSSLLSPVSYAQRIVAGELTPKNFALSLLGISSPKTTPSERTFNSMIFDDRPNLVNQIKNLYSTNQKSQADVLIKDFNTRIINTANDFLVESGKQKLSPEQMQVKLKAYLLKVPSARVLENYKNKSGSFLERLTK